MRKCRIYICFTFSVFERTYSNFSLPLLWLQLTHELKPADRRAYFETFSFISETLVRTPPFFGFIILFIEKDDDVLLRYPKEFPYETQRWFMDKYDVWIINKKIDNVLTTAKSFFRLCVTVLRHIAMLWFLFP